MASPVFTLVFLLTSSVALAQSPQITSVQVPGNTAPGTVSPGAIVTITGSGFQSVASAVQVQAGGAAAYLISASATSLQVQLPVSLPSTPGLNVTLTVTTPTGSASKTIPLNYASPAFVFAPGSAVPVITDFKDQSSHVVPFTVDATHPVVPGDHLEIQAVGVGLTGVPVGGPPAPTGVTPDHPTYSAQVQPSVTVGTTLIPSSATIATLIPGKVGVFAVDFQLPVNGISSGQNSLSLNESGSSTTNAVVPVDSGIAVITGVVNGANFAANTPVAPGSIASLFTSNLESVLYPGIFPQNLVHNTGIAIQFKTTPMFDLLGPQNQVNIQIPTDLPETGPVTVVLSNSKGAGQPFTLQMTPAAPGIFRINSPSGSQNAAVLFSGKKWYAMSSAFAQALGIYTNCTANSVNPQAYCGQPAKAGDYLEIYSTGLGKATLNGDPNAQPIATGITASTNPLILYKTPTTPFVTIGGVSSKVVFSGIAPGFAGLYQVNVIVPNGIAPGNAVPVTISMPISSYSDSASIAIQ